ncbi:MAG: translation initiation factor IF-2 subunit alpha [Thermoplasmata archaeon]
MSNEDDEIFPEDGELVIATVVKVENHGAYVALDEYGGLQGYIPIQEVSTGWVKFIRDFVREDQKVVAKVIRVDREKKMIDLSLKYVTEHEKREKIKHWRNEKRGLKLFEIVAEKLGMSVDEAMKQFGRKLIEKYGGIYPAMEEAVRKRKALKSAGFDGEWVEVFTKVAKENIVPTSAEISGIVELRHNGSEGIIEIKKALAKMIETEPDSISVQYLGAPRYLVIVKAKDFKSAEKILEKGVNTCLSEIKAAGGSGEFKREEEK